MLKPFVKWPGGKTDELKIIHQYLPETIHNYIEPFLGGGACFLSLSQEKYNQAYVNDFSFELYSLYRLIKEQNQLFFQYNKEIWDLWCYFGKFSKCHYKEIKNLYDAFKSNKISIEELKEEVKLFVKTNAKSIEAAMPQSVSINAKQLLIELNKSIVSKIANTKKNELNRGDLPEADYEKNFEASIRASLYTYFRYLYNERAKYQLSTELHISLFFFLREFCYSSMFRYNKSGGFNVPYGGASYNSKSFNNKIEYLRNPELLKIVEKASIHNLDFEEFFRQIPFNENDFIFLDPPYDSDFSTYANHAFAAADQERLANFLLNECSCKFLMIIKNTDFIYQLYKQPGIRMIGFDKAYSVSFMDRNNKNVEHLLIMNY